jgi:hypothetical protein
MISFLPIELENVCESQDIFICFILKTLICYVLSPKIRLETVVKQYFFISIYQLLSNKLQIAEYGLTKLRFLCHYTMTEIIMPPELLLRQV